MENKIARPFKKEDVFQRVFALWAGGTARFQLTPGARVWTHLTGWVQSALSVPLQATEDRDMHRDTSFLLS